VTIEPSRHDVFRIEPPHPRATRRLRLDSACAHGVHECRRAETRPRLSIVGGEHATRDDIAAAFIVSGWVSHRRVEPSTSASSNVTVPVGSSLMSSMSEMSEGSLQLVSLMLASMR
jgi:hypothetical protein